MPAARSKGHSHVAPDPANVVFVLFNEVILRATKALLRLRAQLNFQVPRKSLSEIVNSGPVSTVSFFSAC